MREAAQNLKTKSSLHVKLIEACTECFERLMKDDKNCLTDACATPHVLVHVRMQGFPIWPGKLMSVDGDKAHILFFGDHSQVDIALKHCFLYSEHFCKRNSKNQQLNKAKKVIVFCSFLRSHYNEKSKDLLLHFQQIFNEKFDFSFRKQRPTSKNSSKSLVSSVRPANKLHGLFTIQDL